MFQKFYSSLVLPSWNDGVEEWAIRPSGLIHSWYGTLADARVSGGSIVSQLSEHGLIDEYQMVVNPIVLGKGRTMFEGMSKRLPMKRTRTRTFENGNVLLCYQPVT